MRKTHWILICIVFWVIVLAGCNGLPYDRPDNPVIQAEIHAHETCAEVREACGLRVRGCAVKFRDESGKFTGECIIHYIRNDWATLDHEVAECQYDSLLHVQRQAAYPSQGCAQ